MSITAMKMVVRTNVMRMRSMEGRSLGQLILSLAVDVVFSLTMARLISLLLRRLFISVVDISRYSRVSTGFLLAGCVRIVCVDGLGEI